MKITSLETLSADAGWRSFSFVKLTTDTGITGWSEYNESFGSRGLTEIIDKLAPLVIGQDPRPYERLVSMLHVMTRQSQGGVTHQAIAAIENALLDTKAKDLGIPVHALFGGPVRERIPLYWSHTGTYRARNAEIMGVPPLLSYDDLARHGEDIAKQGFRAMKTNIIPRADGRLVPFNPGFGRTPGWPALNWDEGMLQATRDTLSALRAGAGDKVGLMLDINFHFKTDGFLRVAEAVAPYHLTWLELDTFDAPSLAHVRSRAPCSIASCETLCARRDFRPFFDAYAMDVAIIDVPWNGLAEAVKIAAMADAHEINVAPHNFYGHLCTMQSAHFCASVPNFHTMEIDIDGVPWRDEFYSAPPVIERGELVLPTGPGWGIEVNEAAVRARPPRN
jgi:L-alanine-DL-glutamate epimerase-like enolase superfamily enzyme